MESNDRKDVLHIKKYPNRRYYDITRSKHVTLKSLYGLILEGRDILVSDSRTGDDITNLVLLQILLERDQPKLDLFPSSIVHMMIRSNRQVLQQSVDRYFGPFAKMMSSTQRHFDTYLRKAMQGQLASPIEWANTFVESFSPSNVDRSPTPDFDLDEPDFSGPPEDEPETPMPPNSENSPIGPKQESIADIRDQIAELTTRLDQLSKQDKTEGSDDHVS